MAKDTTIGTYTVGTEDPFVSHFAAQIDEPPSYAAARNASPAKSRMWNPIIRYPLVATVWVGMALVAIFLLRLFMVVIWSI